MQIITKIFLFIILPVSLIQPQKKSSLRNHNFSGTLPVSLAGNLTYGQTDYSSAKFGLGGTGIAEYFFPTYSSTFYGLRFAITGETLKGKDNLKTPSEYKTDMLALGGGLVAGYSFLDKVFPYVYGGVSNVWFSPKDVDGKRLENNRLGNYKRSTITYEGEVGTRVAFSEIISIFLGVGFHFAQSDNLDDIVRGSFDDFYYSAKFGISLSLFSEKDTDGDGIADADDGCPFNAEDFDGFEDDDGCPDIDNDKDRITDAKDNCPNEAEDKDGFQDEDGCPDPDNDGDLIPDKIDKCSNEPENYNGFEDEDGCPDILSGLQISNDRDRDGIPNDLDKCPDQPETINQFQDDDGCPDSVTSIDTSSSDTSSTKEILIESEKLFDWNSTELKITANEELDKIFVILESDPFVKWSVESYTDNNGNPDSLKTTSQKRAISVVRSLINKGLPSFMFKIYAKGPENPIADNNSLEGRMKNNRIVLKRLK